MAEKRKDHQTDDETQDPAEEAGSTEEAQRKAAEERKDKGGYQ